MSSSSHTATAPKLGAQSVVEGLLRARINCGFGIPSIHNIAIYEGLRQAPQFDHWVVRHEQAAGFAADGFYRSSGQIAAVFASTGPGNLFTLVPLLESLQTNTPVLLIGTNIASGLQAKQGGALHETPQQIDILRPLTRFARRVTSADEIPQAFADAATMLRGPAPGPAFIEIAHDFLAAPVSTDVPQSKEAKPRAPDLTHDLTPAAKLVAQSRRPALLVGSGIHGAVTETQRLAEQLCAPVLTTTTGKSNFAADHPLAFGCMSRLGAVQELLEESDLLISVGARLTEFDTGRFGLKLPPTHIQIVDSPDYPGTRFPASLVLMGDIAAITTALVEPTEKPRSAWFATGDAKEREQARLAGLNSDAYRAIQLLRSALDRHDVVANDQSILNYWASAFFPVLEPRSFLYPAGSGTLGYGLPAAIGAALAARQQGSNHRIICIAGDGGFQYTLHELATLKQYDLPVKILLVNDEAYGVIGFLQRSVFGQMHEVNLKNPDFCVLAEAYGISAARATSFAELSHKLPAWLNAPGPALLEWRTTLQAPWETGAIPRPANTANKEPE
ncbi:MAG TPA: thiamine pyrophosphate-binding protein [Candidatus Acidoferrales bacterium]|nr:thiamine pyrophosphate-binding protein [Candidatus Acidoferrales bacterium]